MQVSPITAAKIKLKKHKRKTKYKNVNQAPGKVVYVGDKKKAAASFDIIVYDDEENERYQTNKIEAIFERWEDDKMTWINVRGLNDTQAVEALGKRFGLHPLVLEDIVDTHQRPKFDEYPKYLFLVAKMLYLSDDDDITYSNEHLSIVVGPNYVLTFQESEKDVFERLRERIQNGLGLRSSKSDYLMYTLLDAVVDNYYLVIESLGGRIESLENCIFLGKADEEDIVQDIQNLRPEIIQMRRAVNPLRDMTSHLENSTHDLITLKTYNYLRDLHDHSLQVTETVEIYREMTGNLMDMYISTISNKMNEVMKVLTIMASIFIPLTFIAGIYGMNFDYMPELHLRYGYFYVWGFMILLILLMLWYFKRKKWL